VDKKTKNDLWRSRAAARPKRRERFVLAVLIAAGGLSIARLADWWFREEHAGAWPLFLALTLIFWWGLTRTLVLWTNYLGVRKPNAPAPAPPGLRVAIFTTSSPGEPLSMFEKTLEACAQIRYPHTTYLLDDTRDPRFREVAEKHGAVWLELVGLPGAKAGKINAALQRTQEEFVLVLDPDHVPFPNFLDEVLGYFAEETVGFVQVSQAYYNQDRSFTARGAAEQTYGFYGPTQMGLHGYGCAVAIGANCTFRRRALESIGGHGIGLAEDLVTAIRLHAAGWRSVYAPVIVSRGLVPEDFGSFCKQQLKWARGVHEVLFAEWPRLFARLSGWQRLSYFMIGTYYLVGATSFLYLVFPYLFFWGGLLPAAMDFRDFLLYWLPVALFSVAIYLYVQHWMCDPGRERGLHWRGMVLKFACWPVFLLGFLLSLVNARIPYIPTAKQAVRGFTPFARPLLVQAGVFVVSLVYVVVQRAAFLPEATLALTSERTWGMIAFASIAFFMTAGGLYAAAESHKLPVDDPWDSIDVPAVVRLNPAPAVEAYPTTNAHSIELQYD
jgi:cellulose synthase (UDP-forming)